MTILEMNLYASVLILAVVVTRALTVHKLPKKTFLVLWGVVIIRLIIPFSIASRFSIYTAINRLRNALTEQGTTVLYDIPMPSVGVIPHTITPAEALPVSTGISPLIIVWLAGMAACMLFFVVTHYRCRREYQSALPIENSYIQKWMAEHPLKRSVKIRQSEQITAPLTYGIGWPVVLLPKTMDWTNEEQLEYVLLHEYTHIKRFDIVAKWLLTIAVSIHWFNPLVWAMYRLANRDLELSCDETVVHLLGEGLKSNYAMTLISLEEKRSRLAPLCNSFSQNAIEERIVSIMKMKKTSLVGILLALFVVTGVTTAFATSNLSSDISLIQQSTHVTSEISSHIEDVLKNHSINITSIVPSQNAITEGMDANWMAYDLSSTEGGLYLLIVRADGKDFTALLDSENNLLEGIVDNGVLPKYYETDTSSNPSKTETIRFGADPAEMVDGMVPLEMNGYAGWVKASEAEIDTASFSLDYPDGVKRIDIYDNDRTTAIGAMEIWLKSDDEIVLGINYATNQNKVNEENSLYNQSETGEPITADESVTILVDNIVLKPIDEYLSFGLFYNENEGQFFYNDKPVSSLIDADNLIYADPSQDEEGVSLKVIRDNNGEIEKLIEMKAEAVR